MSGGVACELGHRFDRAVEGYLNLLPAGRHKGRPGGDSAEMVRARRAVFDAGHYRPVMVAVADACAGAEAVLDAGCGEGSYLESIIAAERCGIDVSKPAVRLAAKRSSAGAFAVASCYRLPLDDARFDAVVSVFAPRPFGEFSRVLRSNGVIVTATPAPEHLCGLRDYLYRDARPHATPSQVVDECPDAPVDVERVSYELSLGPDDARQLLQMTPYWWSATPEQRAEVGALVTTVDVFVSTYRRLGSRAPAPGRG